MCENSIFNAAYDAKIIRSSYLALKSASMSGDRYHIQNQQGLYFITPTVIQWVDVFSRREYRDIIVDSLNYCIREKGLVVNSWVIMSNHLHLVLRVEESNRLSDVLRDFKKFTSKAIMKAIVDIPESRREWLLDKFAFEAKRTRRAENYKLWKDSNRAISLDEGIDVWEKINYTHLNPVKAGIVDDPEDYIYSSARDYLGVKGLVDVEVMV